MSTIYITHPEASYKIHGSYFYVASLLGDVEYYRPLALKFYPNRRDFTNVNLPEKSALTLVK